MKSNNVIEKIKDVLNLNEEVKLEQAKLDNGTVIEADSFESGVEVFIVTEDEKVALPIGEYSLEDGKLLVVVEEGVISEIKEEEAEEEVEEMMESEEEVEESEEAEEIDEELSLEEIISTLKEMTEEDEVEETYESEDMDEEEEVDESNALEEAYATIESLRGTINEVNLLNAKLLYTNKLFRTFNLNESQKMKVIENFDRAESLREVKLVFATLGENLNVAKKPKTVVKESLASKPMTSSAPKKEIISEGSQVADRFKKLAGLIK